MSAKETPLAKVKRLFGTKEKLVDAVVDLVDKSSTDESPDALKARLLGVSNKKLLRLHESLGEIKNKYGSKEKLVEALTTAHGKGKDGDYAGKLETYTVNRLMDMMQTAKKAARRSSRAEG